MLVRRECEPPCGPGVNYGGCPPVRSPLVSPAHRNLARDPAQGSDAVCDATLNYSVAVCHKASGNCIETKLVITRIGECIRTTEGKIGIDDCQRGRDLVRSMLTGNCHGTARRGGQRCSVNSALQTNRSAVAAVC